MGDVWHYDGSAWRRIPFPGETDLFSVCCGKDGAVYLSRSGGAVFVWRNETWQKVNSPKISRFFRDMVWFDGRVWCTNNDGVWVIEDDTIREPEGVPEFVFHCRGNLYAGDGVLLLARHHGAAFCEGGVWHEILDIDRMKEMLDKSSSP